MPEPAAWVTVAQIRELEVQLDRLLDQATRRDACEVFAADGDDDDPLEAGARRVADRPVVPPPTRAEAALEADGPTVLDDARDGLSTTDTLRTWGALQTHALETDAFGFDPVHDAKVRRALELLYTKYFHVETIGVEHVPAFGRCLLVSNHSGMSSLDGLLIKMAVTLEHPVPRDVRWLTDDVIFRLPYVGSTAHRLGAMSACPENAERLLAKEALVAVFPEGTRGTGNRFSEPFRFGRQELIALCLRTRTPIVPVAVVGAEETPILSRIGRLAKAIGLPVAALPRIGVRPPPTRWQIHFGEPIDLDAHGPDAAEDGAIVFEQAERVRAAIHGMLERAVAARKPPFSGRA